MPFTGRFVEGRSCSVLFEADTNSDDAAVGVSWVLNTQPIVFVPAGAGPPVTGKALAFKDVRFNVREPIGKWWLTITCGADTWRREADLRRRANVGGRPRAAAGSNRFRLGAGRFAPRGRVGFSSMSQFGGLEHQMDADWGGAVEGAGVVGTQKASLASGIEAPLCSIRQRETNARLS